MTVSSKHFAHCPDCGHTKECESLRNAQRYANEHNRRCKEQRKPFPRIDPVKAREDAFWREQEAD